MLGPAAAVAESSTEGNSWGVRCVGKAVANDMARFLSVNGFRPFFYAQHSAHWMTKESNVYCAFVRFALSDSSVPAVISYLC